jgi:hypothetical protein
VSSCVLQIWDVTLSFDDHRRPSLWCETSELTERWGRRRLSLVAEIQKRDAWAISFKIP